jgi:hypothetical protein
MWVFSRVDFLFSKLPQGHLSIPVSGFRMIVVSTSIHIISVVSQLNIFHMPTIIHAGNGLFFVNFTDMVISRLGRLEISFTSINTTEMIFHSMILKTICIFIRGLALFDSTNNGHF